ncbi:MAG TPA: beta-ketoacyl-[acyl-carrier-protein] synthase family protein [Burkholderiales bacterium]|nr:beta-ketoacyl-[acyl-carrier-protein] synthase family protein [Burkholderiales bacterium]
MSAARCFVHAVGIANALGTGVDAVRAGLLAGDTSGMRLRTGWLAGDAPARVGEVLAGLPAVPSPHAYLDCRNNGLFLLALAQIDPVVRAEVARFGPHRFGVVLGTSTTGIAEGEAAIARFDREQRFPPEYHYAQQEIGTAAPLLAALIGAAGPAFVVSTACTSSAKAIASACRLIRQGICDAVLTGGADALCRLTVRGFTALESTTPELCNPLSRNRRGINLGEGAALLLVSRAPAAAEILGCGESSDAHHISAPDPEGAGAEIAMRAALREAGLAPEAVDYLNLHATATPKNDQMEALAVHRVFPRGVPCSGTKPLTGHTLGAAGATEAAFCVLALQGDGRLPPHVWDGERDAGLPGLAATAPGDRFARASGRVCMSNSFAFGGSNACLVLGDAR